MSCCQHDTPGAGDGERQSAVEVSQRLTLQQIIAEGSMAVVHCGIFDGRPAAVKQFRPAVIAGLDQGQQCFNREIAALSSCQHPHVVKMLGLHTEVTLALILELCEGGDLSHLLHQRPEVKVSFEQQRSICTQVANAMAFLHSSSPALMHRDLKSPNLLLHSPVNGPEDNVLVKVADFSLACWHPQQHSKERAPGIRGVSPGSPPPALTIAVGTAQWTAPEVFISGHYDLKADVYSFGCILYEVLSRRIPFDDLEPLEVMRAVIGRQRPSLEFLPEDIPGHLRDLLMVCWAQAPWRRPSSEEVFHFFSHL